MLGFWLSKPVYGEIKCLDKLLGFMMHFICMSALHN